MKKENIVHDLKTAAVVATGVLALNSCGKNKTLTPEQLQTVEHKIDSAKHFHREYKMAEDLSDLCSSKIEEYHNANVGLVKKYSKEYIEKNIQKPQLRKFMLTAVINEKVVSDYIDDSDSNIETDSVTNDTDFDCLSPMRYIRNNERWFNDLMMYLTSKYTDRQLLNSEFFKVIKDKKLRKNFEFNTNQIENLQPSLDFTIERKAAIQSELRNKYTKEVLHTKQR
jgi:hypothetical protein